MTNKWLDDETINSYLDLLNEHVQVKNKQLKFMPTYCSDTFFYTVTCEKNRRLGYEDKIIKYCEKMRSLVSLERVHKWIIPIHSGGVHWKLLVVLVQCGIFILYDSMETCPDHKSEHQTMYDVDSIRHFITKYGQVHNLEMFKKCPWMLVRRNLYREEQGDTSSCGVYVLSVAEAYANSDLANGIFYNITLFDIERRRTDIKKNIRGRKLFTLISSYGMQYSMIAASHRSLEDVKLHIPKNDNTKLLGTNLTFIYDNLTSCDRSRFLVTSMKKFKANKLLWTAKLFESQFDTTKVTPKEAKGLSRDQLVWSKDDAFLNVIQSKARVWFERIIMKYINQRELVLVSIVESNSHTWRDQLIFERTILELVYCKNRSIKVKLYIIFNGSTNLNLLGGGYCVPIQDYSPQSVEVFAKKVLSSRPQNLQDPMDEETDYEETSRNSDNKKDKKNKKRHLKETHASRTRDKREKRYEDTSVSEASDKEGNGDEYDTDMELSDIGKRLSISDNSDVHTASVNLVMDDYVYSLMCLNDSVYHLATSFPPEFMQVTLYESADDLLVDFGKNITQVNIAISGSASPADTNISLVREKIIQYSGGQFIMVDMPVEKISDTRMVVQIQKARNNSQAFKSRDMSESSGDEERSGNEYLLGSDSRSMTKNLYPLYENEHIVRSVSNISLE